MTIQSGHDRRQPPEELSRWPVLGAWVNGLTTDSFFDLVSHSVDKKQRVTILNHNVNSLAIFHRDSDFRDFYDTADYCFIDGAPVVPLVRLEGNLASRANRLAVLDWFWLLMSEAENNCWRVTHIGSDRENIETVRLLVSERAPAAQVTFIDGFFDMDDPSENTQALNAVRLSEPDILLVGMGMPRQERWLKANLAQLPDCVAVTVGGVIGYIGGDRPTPPRWLGSLGIEWAYRLVTEPRRLWRRYLVEPAPLIPIICRRAAVRVAAHVSRGSR